MGLSSSLFKYAFFITLVSASHLVTGSHHFVIIDADEPQLYRLFGVLPKLYDLKAQLVISTLLAVLIGLPTLLYIVLRPRHPYANWTSRLPDSVVNLLFYLGLEFSAYKEVLASEMMSLMSTPLGIGLDIAANVSMWSPLGTRDRHSSNTGGPPNGTSPYPRTGRSVLRRKQQFNNGPSLANGVASTSKTAIGSQSSHYPGLYNTGNSCFLNSTLQSLASLDVLKEYMERVMELAERWDVPTPVTDALYDLLAELNTPLIKRSALIPRQLTDALSNLPQTNVGSFFYAHQQQDAHELLVLLTGAIDDEMNVVLSEQEYMQKRQAVGLQSVMAPSIPSLYSSSSFASSSTNPFRSLVAQRTACLECGYVEAVRHYPTDELSLGVPFRAGSAATLEMCLKSWSKLEKVDWICFRCSLHKTLDKVRADVKRLTRGTANGNDGGGAAAKEGGVDSGSSKMSNSKKKKLREVRRKETVLSSILDGCFSEDEVENARLLEKAEVRLERTFSALATKQVMIARTPKVLLLHLNRSSYSTSNFGASKNNATVLFDEFLDLSEVVTSGELNISGDVPISATAGVRHNLGATLGGREQQTLYRLCAIVVHYGSHSAGHYVSFRRRSIKAKRSDALSDDVDQDSSARHAYHDGWFRISDDSVSPCSLRDVQAQNPFILFYERLEEGPDGRVALKKDSTPTANGLSSLPSGFETFGRNQMQRRRNAFQPRVVERWNAVH